MREGKLYFANSIFIKWQVSFSTPHLGHHSPPPAPHPRIARSLSWQADFLNLMPSTCRRLTLYNLSWALLALKATLSMTRTINNGAVVWEYPRFEKQACASAEMYARCDAKVALPPIPSHTSPSLIAHIDQISVRCWLDTPSPRRRETAHAHYAHDECAGRAWVSLGTSYSVSPRL